MTNFIERFFRCSIFLFYILNVASCTSAQQNNKINCDTYVEKIKATEQYKKDSLLLSYTVYQWIDSCYGWFGHYNRRNAPNGSYKIHVGDIFYDSAKLKLTAFVFVEYSSDYVDTLYEKVNNSNAHFFDSHVAMGYRDSANQVWKLFELGEIFIGLRSETLKKAEDFQANIFLNEQEMRNRQVAIYDAKTGLNTKYESVKYLPCEDSFWTHSPLWKKGDRVLGYYIFETFMNATPLKKDLRPVCNIIYPDSLLKLYR